MSAPAPTVVLAQLPLAGYDLTVIAENRGVARHALLRAYRKALADGAIEVVPFGEDPLEWLGARFHDLTLGKVEWL